MTRTELIDRGDELARLAALLAGAERGESAFVLLSGEAGVGKSRVLDEFVSQVSEDVDVFVGACVDVGDAGLPFAPVTEVLRRLVRARGAERVSGLVGASRFELARLVPQVLGGEVDPPEHPTSATQARLFSAVLDAFEQLAGDKPLAVAFEDLHWADESTLALLQYVARNLRAAHTLVLGTLRTNELERSHPRRRLLGELARVPTVTQVPLAPFGREEVAAQIATLLDGEPEPSMVDEIAARSDGNPFFVEELLARYRAGGDSQPSGTLRDVLLSPLRSLPHETRQLIDVVAAVGRPVGHRLLGAITGRSTVELAECLRPAVEQHLLVEGADERYTFRHGLTQETVYNELLGSERASMHRSVAEALSSHRELAAGGSENVDAELARHWEAAQLPASTRGRPATSTRRWARATAGRGRRRPSCAVATPSRCTAAATASR